jgi:hypothetical protein
MWSGSSGVAHRQMNSPTASPGESARYRSRVSTSRLPATPDEVVEWARWKLAACGMLDRYASNQVELVGQQERDDGA